MFTCSSRVIEMMQFSWGLKQWGMTYHKEKVLGDKLSSVGRAVGLMAMPRPSVIEPGMSSEVA